jgi:lipoprotein signal peptidase
VRRCRTYPSELIVSSVSGVVLFVCDQILKAVALTTEYEYRCLTNDFICFGLTQNDRSAFGLFAVGSGVFMLLIPVLLVAVNIILLNFVARPYSIYVVMLFSVGALSNWFDRLRLGYVIDYFGIRIPTANLADACILFAVGVLIYGLNRSKKFR